MENLFIMPMMELNTGALDWRSFVKKYDHMSLRDFYHQARRSDQISATII